MTPDPPAPGRSVAAERRLPRGARGVVYHRALMSLRAPLLSSSLLTAVLLLGSLAAAQEPPPSPSPDPSPAPAPDPNPDPDPAPAPAPDPNPAPAPDSAPDPNPDPNPAPDPAPDPDPSPLPDPSEPPPTAAFPSPPATAPAPPPSASSASPPPESAPTPSPSASTTPPSPPLRTSTTTPSPAVTGEDDRAEKKDKSGLLGPFRLGPVVGVGLPNLLSFGGQLKVTRFFAVGVNVGLIPTVHIAYYGEATLDYQEYDAYGRLHPFGGAFFLGAGVGYERVTGTLTKAFDVSAYQPLAPELPPLLELRSEGFVQTMVLTPQLGLFHTFKPGFSIGLDVGAQIPIAPSEVSFATRVPPGVPQAVVDATVTPNDEKVRSTLERVGQSPLPTVNVRIGWLL